MNIDATAQLNAKEELDGMVKGAPNEAERVKAMRDFAKNVSPGDYIDYDIYGRGEIHAFSNVSGHDDQANAEGNGNNTSSSSNPSPRTFMVPMNHLGKKVRGFVAKLSGSMNCLGKRNSEANEEEAEPFLSPLTNESHSPSLENRQASSIHHALVEGDTPISAEEKPVGQRVGRKRVSDASGDGVCEEQKAVKDNIPCRVDDGNMDETPRRVKSKMGSEEDTSVVEKGTIVRTIAKLRSTGSFAFMEPTSMRREGGESHDAAPPREESSSVASKSTPSSDAESKDRVGELSLVDEHEASVTLIGSGRVEALRSMFGEDEPQTAEQVVILDGLTTRESHAKTEVKATQPDKSESLAETEGTVLVPGTGRSEAELCSLKELSSHLSGRVEKLRSLFECASSETHGVVAEQIRRVPVHHRGLSCDSAAFDENQSQGSDEMEGETRLAVGRHENEEAESGRNAPSDKVVVRSVRGSNDLDIRKSAADGESGRAANSTNEVGSGETRVLPKNVDVVAVGTAGGNEDGVKKNHLEPEPNAIVAADAAASRTIRRSQNESSGEVAEVAEVDSVIASSTRSDSVVASVDLSQPMSHLVGSCVIV
eukprot:gb/GEZJ01000484.1/.p1 GENE.gb/GEZJ01000484.1/~~gb/GEZJ01000484.1/.p1  ORF type:complete len:596 (-),score=95.03 gb/GEZJ01000484.1/:2205-3992(-)